MELVLGTGRVRVVDYYVLFYFYFISIFSYFILFLGPQGLYERCCGWVGPWVRGQFLKPVSYWSEFIAVAVAVEGMAR